MNNGSIKIMTIIAVILQALATVLGFGIVALQKTLLHTFFYIACGRYTAK